MEDVMNYGKHMDQTQREPLRGRKMVANNQGGYSFEVNDWSRLTRFLVLGSEGGTFYVSERELTRQNASVVERLLKEDGVRVVNEIVEISQDGRAPKNDAALFALAMCLKLGDVDARRCARAAVPLVARTGTHLFDLANAVKAFGGWGRGTQAAFEGWYNALTPEKLAYQVAKYQQRNGWSHRDILRKVHLQPTAEKQAILRWAVKGETSGLAGNDATKVIWAFEQAKTAKGKSLIRLITDFGLPHECVPNEAKGDPAVWEAMLPNMGVTAIVRNLGKMTSIGLLAPMSNAATFIQQRLNDEELLKKGKVHPLNLLVALKTYAQGHGDKGKLAWQPVQGVTNALDSAFYKAFKAVEPTNKRTLLALDVSGSMTCSNISGMSGITPRLGSAAMALVTANVEPIHHFMGFSHTFIKLDVNPKMRLDAVVNYFDRIPFGGTDCSLPMRWAQQNKIPVDTFVVYTDSETGATYQHPAQQLKEYRQKMGIGAKLVVVGMTANGFTIADPNDAGMLDVVGFDTATPAVLADFARD